MRYDHHIKILLGIVAALLFLNVASALFPVRHAVAQRDADIGRYQIAAWAAQMAPTASHSGYYVLDTVTGKVVDSRAAVTVPVPPEP